MKCVHLEKRDLKNNRIMVVLVVLSNHGDINTHGRTQPPMKGGRLCCIIEVHIHNKEGSQYCTHISMPIHDAVYNCSHMTHCITTSNKQTFSQDLQEILGKFLKILKTCSIVLHVYFFTYPIFGIHFNLCESAFSTLTVKRSFCVL